jgi:hypothetical protein
MARQFITGHRLALKACLKADEAEGVDMHLGSVLLIVWLVVGGFAAGQRGEYHAATDNCSNASTAAVTILAGPLNYLGMNPDIHCTAPRPSS